MNQIRKSTFFKRFFYFVGIVLMIMVIPFLFVNEVTAKREPGGGGGGKGTGGGKGGKQSCDPSAYELTLEQFIPCDGNYTQYVYKMNVHEGCSPLQYWMLDFPFCENVVSMTPNSSSEAISIECANPDRKTKISGLKVNNPQSSASEMIFNLKIEGCYCRNIGSYYAMAEGCRSPMPGSVEVPCSCVCGNGTIEAGEECDDGNQVNGDGCSSTCTNEVSGNCGDGTMQEGEECDDSGESATCDPDCTMAMCGDGYMNAKAGEQCDHGGTPTETCMADCSWPYCGDGVMDSGEECDDGNQVNGDGCSSTCTNEVSGNCGDGIMQEGEECDDSGESASCDTDCTLASCGDRCINFTGGEECDDGNSYNGDGCSALCQIE